MKIKKNAFSSLVFANPNSVVKNLNSKKNPKIVSPYKVVHTTVNVQWLKK
jgi:hypothetical protein